ncbi:MAG: PglD N-terminal domain, partial [Bacteroidota bacterium]
MKKRIVIIGAGGHGKVVAETILLSDLYSIAGFIDDQR